MLFHNLYNNNFISFFYYITFFYFNLSKSTINGCDNFSWIIFRNCFCLCSFIFKIFKFSLNWISLFIKNCHLFVWCKKFSLKYWLFSWNLNHIFTYLSVLNIFKNDLSRFTMTTLSMNIYIVFISFKARYFRNNLILFFFFIGDKFNLIKIVIKIYYSYYLI